MTPSRGDPSELQVNMFKLLSQSILHIDQVQKDLERVRSRLASLPWDILDRSGRGSLEEGGELLLQCERRMLHAKQQIELQKNRAGTA